MSIDVVVHHDLVDQALDQRPGQAAGSGVTRPTQRDDRRGVSTGTGMSRRRWSPASSAYCLHHLGGS